MTPERWKEIKGILDTALELEGAKRQVWLDSQCGQDLSLRGEVESFLEEEEELASFIVDPVFELHGNSPPEATLEEMIGPYRIEGELGRGGMGAVYLAKREGDFEKKVALKVLKRGMDTDEIARRFRHERQILANLDHPNIAHLLDGGSTRSGRPYFVLEYVEGERIDRYCEQQRLDIGARLDLFLQVCSAVQKAHQNLVVHRDLKPGNILITPGGRPKLLDFGIAKLLDSDAPDLTQMNPDGPAGPMTPDYASPEQINGEVVTTASDVYSLGVLLYELLTGHRPHRIRSRDRAKMEAAILSEVPARPSSVISRSDDTEVSGDRFLSRTPESVSATREGTYNKLRQRLKGDLDWITLKALEKDPNDRYASVEQLAEDIRRHLRGEPIVARRANPGYRLLKFIRRNRLWLGAAAVALLLVGNMVWQEYRAQMQARLVDAVMLMVFSKDSFQLSTSPEANVTMLKEVAEEFTEARGISTADQARTLATLGEALVNQNQFESAQPVLQKALSQTRSLYGPDDVRVAEIQEGLAELHLINDQPEIAEDLLLDALATYQTQESPEAYRNTIVAQHGLARVYLGLERQAEAKAMLESSVEEFRQAFGPEHPYTAIAIGNLAQALDLEGQREESLSLFRNAKSIWDRYPDTDNPHRARTLQNLGAVLSKLGKQEEAETYLREALSIQEKVLGPSHSLVALTLGNLSHTLSGPNTRKEREQLLRRAIEIEEGLRRDHPRLGIYRATLAQELSNQSRFVEAIKLYRSGFALAANSQHIDPDENVRQQAGFGFALLRTGQLAEAESQQRKVAKLRRELLAQDPDAESLNEDLAITLTHLANALGQQGKCEAIDDVLLEASDVLTKGHENEQWRRAEMDGIRGDCLRQQGEFAQAETMLLASRGTLESTNGVSPWRKDDARERLFTLYTAWEKPAEAARYAPAMDEDPAPEADAGPSTPQVSSPSAPLG